MTWLYWQFVEWRFWLYNKRKDFYRFIARKLLRSEINFMLRLLDYSVTDQDISRDGKPAVYYEGKIDGIKASLLMLFDMREL